MWLYLYSVERSWGHWKPDVEPGAEAEATVNMEWNILY